MKSKIFMSGIVLTLSLFSTLSFAECGMDRKLELLKEMNEVLEEKTMLLSEARSDKRTEQRLRSLSNRERELRYEYEVVCNVE